MLVAMEESSVLFNLQEIMRLERDRVAADEAAARAAQAHATAQREARVREQREQAERERAAREHAEAERARVALEAVRAEETERAAALLRIRMEAEAQERLAARQLELARTEQLQALAEDQRRKRASWAMACALLTLCLASGAAYAYVLEPALRTARERSAALDQLTADAATQTAALARQVEELRAQRQREAARPAPNLTPSQTAAPTRPRPRPTQAITKPATKPADTTLDTLDTKNDDPLWGLSDPGSKPKPKRR